MNSSTHLPLFALPARRRSLSQLSPLSINSTSAHHRDINARPQPASGVFAFKARRLPRIDLAQAILIPPNHCYFHDHITNEQIHVAKSIRHTLNPTGARASEEERRRESGDLNYRSAKRSTTSECRCPCRRRRRR